MVLPPPTLLSQRDLLLRAAPPLMLYIINTQKFQILAAVIGVVDPYPIPTPLYCVCVSVLSSFPGWP